MRTENRIAVGAVLYKRSAGSSKRPHIYQRGLATCVRALGPQHPKTLTCRDNYEASGRD